jgi:hypothetical protein
MTDRSLKVSVLAGTAMVACLAGAGGAQAQLPHFRCYVITPGTSLNQPVGLADQFREDTVTVRAPHLLCTPVEKTVGDGQPEQFGEGDHLKCYQTTPAGPPARAAVTLFDQFHPEEAGGEAVTVMTPHLLCTPATKSTE